MLRKSRPLRADKHCVDESLLSTNTVTIGNGQNVENSINPPSSSIGHTFRLAMFKYGRDTLEQSGVTKVQVRRCSGPAKKFEGICEGI
jgi:hypothetical protein